MNFNIFNISLQKESVHIDPAYERSLFEIIRSKGENRLAASASKRQTDASVWTYV